MPQQRVNLQFKNKPFRLHKEENAMFAYDREPSYTLAADPISTDLLHAWERSEKKPEGWTYEDATRALDRYERFLRLAAAYPGVAQAPTRDIDEMWHLHMLSPVAYHRDCMQLFGKILDHDGGSGKEESEAQELKTTFEQTSRMWQQMYGESYVAMDSQEATKCWHDCVGRCWHACSSKPAAPPLSPE